MLPFSPTELDEMRVAQERAMQDICLIAEPNLAQDKYNLTKESWNWFSAMISICGFEANPPQEVLNQVPTSDVIVRLPVSTPITYRARVRIVKRFGEEITPITYAVVGSPKRGPSGLQVWLKKITDGSDG